MFNRKIVWTRQRNQERTCQFWHLFRNRSRRLGTFEVTVIAEVWSVCVVSEVLWGCSQSQSDSQWVGCFKFHTLSWPSTHTGIYLVLIACYCDFSLISGVRVCLRKQIVSSSVNICGMCWLMRLHCSPHFRSFSVADNDVDLLLQLLSTRQQGDLSFWPVMHYTRNTSSR